MNQDIFGIQNSLTASLQKGLQALGQEALPITLEKPKDAGHGDLSTPLAMSLAKKLRQNPLVIAKDLLARTEWDPSLIEKAEVAPPGYLNLWLKPSALQSRLAALIQEGDRYGSNQELKDWHLLLEFVSANPTGPLNVVNARAAVLGDAIRKLVQASGGRIATEYYINDAGNQARLFGESLAAALSRAQGTHQEAPEGGYQGAYMDDLARMALGQFPASDPKLHDPQFLGEWGMDRMVDGQRASLERYGVQFDRWFSERRGLHDTGLVQRAFQKLKSMGLTYEKDGAVWIKATEFGGPKDEVLIKSNGIPAYIVADIAYHLDKLGRGFDRVVNIMGPDHHGHILSMKATHQALGFAPDRFEVLVAQQVSLLSGGEKVKMSKREGKFVTMEELLDQVGRDAARFFFLMRGANTHLDFDIEVAKKQTEENPVFYIQYAHARICSLIRKGADRGRRPATEPAQFALLVEPEEKLLMRELLEFPKWVADSARAYEPHRIIIYLQTLAADFHLYYSKHRVLDSEENLSSARLGLARGVSRVIHNALSLLGVSAPEQM
ncbi:MAG TPA: arginine--tRNA ligase [bacterium]|nr:arginine--tRNA ligase [bacterium]